MSILYSSSHTSDNFLKDHESLLVAASHDKRITDYTSIENTIYISFLESEIEKKNFHLVLKDLEIYFLKQTLSNLKYKLDVNRVDHDYFHFKFETS